MPSRYLAYTEYRKSVLRYRAMADSIILPGGKVRRDGRDLINFASNDYLGLSQHPALKEMAAIYAERFGVGATASRLICGNNPVFAEIETMLAKGKGQEAALLLAAGYQTNLTVLAALADKKALKADTVIIADKLAHNSILMGATLSEAKLVRFAHNDMDHLAKTLAREAATSRQLLVVTESVFGMDGDVADLAAIGKLARQYAAIVYVDEAHATGVMGKNGFGLTADYPGAVDIAMGTCSKALGAFGSYIACTDEIRDYLVQRCAGLIYSTALPPPVAGTIAAALRLIPAMSDERAALAKTAAYVRKKLSAQGWDCGASSTHIIPIIIGEEDKTLALSARLLEAGFWVPAIRPPTVPADKSRLRLSLSAVHARADIDRFLAAMTREAMT